VYSPRTTKLSQPDNPFIAKGQEQEAYYFECSYPTCSALVLVKFLSPIFSPHLVALMTDETLLNKRLDEALNLDPKRLEGLSRPMPINVLSNLKTYIENSLEAEQRNRVITSTNKRFMSCFGVCGRPCRELLDFLEFTSKASPPVFRKDPSMNGMIDKSPGERYLLDTPASGSFRLNSL
jgi:ubiquitin carboxyl-terminal hydrolase 25/28